MSLDYHVEVDKHYYSVPHSLLRQQLDVRLTESTVELFQRRQRVAVHVRSRRKRLSALAKTDLLVLDDLALNP